MYLKTIKKIKYPKQGDIISSPEFENLIMCRDENFKLIYNSSDLKSHQKYKTFLVNPPSKFNIGKLEEEFDTEYLKKINKNTKFVVIAAVYVDGGWGGGLYQEHYSPVYQVTAKELNKNKTWKENGILINFNEYRTDVQHAVKNISFHGKMKIKFV